MDNTFHVSKTNIRSKSSLFPLLLPLPLLLICHSVAYWCCKRGLWCKHTMVAGGQSYFHGPACFIVHALEPFFICGRSILSHQVWQSSEWSPTVDILTSSRRKNRLTWTSNKVKFLPHKELDFVGVKWTREVWNIKNDTANHSRCFE